VVAGRGVGGATAGEVGDLVAAAARRRPARGGPPRRFPSKLTHLIGKVTGLTEMPGGTSMGHGRKPTPHRLRAVGTVEGPSRRMAWTAGLR